MSRPLTEAQKKAAKFPASKTIAEHILTNAQDSRPEVHDFVPLAESMEWELGSSTSRTAATRRLSPTHGQCHSSYIMTATFRATPQSFRSQASWNLIRPTILSRT
jgi:hypothetical protein